MMHKFQVFISSLASFTYGNAIGNENQEEGREKNRGHGKFMNKGKLEEFQMYNFFLSKL